jgi:flagellar biosynthesis protein FlhA
MASLFCTLFGLVVFVAFTRLPLTKGTGIDSTILSLVSGLVHIDGSIIGIITSFILLIVICAVMTVIIIKGLTRVIEVAAQFSLDAMPVKIMAAECEYNSGEISEETFIARKDNILRRTDFFGAMEGANKFVTGSAKVMIIIIALELLGGIIIGTRFHGQTIQEATKTVIAFCLSEAIIFLLPLFLLSAAMCTIITRISFPEE